MKRREREKRPQQHTPPTASSQRMTWKEFCEAAYTVCYVVGTRSVRCLRSAVRFTRVLWRPLARALYRATDWLFLRHARRLGEEWRALRADFALAKERVKGRKRRYVIGLLKLPVLAVRRHRAVFTTLLNLAAPVAALLLLVSTVHYWQQARFVLALEYAGEPIGYIASEEVYGEAAALVESMVIDEENVFRVESAPKMTLTVAPKTEVLDADGVKNAILNTVGDAVVETAGLYVDGIFRGAYPRPKLEKMMADILADNKDPNADYVDFFPTVTVVDGLFPSSSVRTAEQMKAYLHIVPIKSVRYTTRTETLVYSTVVQENTAQPLGYQAIKTHGKNGKQKVTEEIITVNGKEQYRTVVSTEILKAPVTQVVVVGAQKYSEGASKGDGKATGIFVWPLPYTKVISSPFASRWGSFHGAIDISNGSTNGKPIIASDGGVVEEAEYHGSYGYYVLINHGNGYKTRYAHCSKLNVEAGQKVAQGEYIANVGNTGYSFGAHLHFEIIKNGQLVDPLNYVKR